MRRALRTTAALIVTASTSLALAEPAETLQRRAAQSFREGQAAFERREFAAAAAAFDEAAALVPHPSAWIDAADAWERSGDPVHAAEDLDRALALPQLDATYQREAERRLATLTARVGTLDFRGPRTLSARVDGGPATNAPFRRRVSPGRHLVSSVDLSTNQARSTELDVAAGATRVVDFTPPAPRDAPRDPPRADASRAVPPSPASPPPAPPPSPAFPPLAVAAAGLAVGAAAVGVTFGLLTVSARDDYDAVPDAATRDGFYRNRRITNIAAGVAVGAAALAVVLWRLGSNTAVVAASERGGALVSARIGFDR